MSRPSSSQTDFAEAEASLRRIAEMVGNYSKIFCKIFNTNLWQPLKKVAFYLALEL